MRTAIIFLIALCQLGFLSALRFDFQSIGGQNKCSIYEGVDAFVPLAEDAVNQCGRNYPINFSVACAAQFVRHTGNPSIVDNTSHTGYGTLFRAVNVLALDDSGVTYYPEFSFKFISLLSHERWGDDEYPLIRMDSSGLRRRFNCRLKPDYFLGDIEIHPEYFSDLKWKHHVDPYLAANTLNCPGVSRSNMKECGTDGNPPCLMYWPIAYQEQCNRCYKATFRLDFPIWDFAMHGRGKNIDLNMRFAGTTADTAGVTEPGKWFNFQQNFIIAIARECPKICTSGSSVTCSPNVGDTCAGPTINFDTALSNAHANSLATLIHENLYVREVDCQTRKDGNFCIERFMANPIAYGSTKIVFDFFTGIPKCDCGLGYVWNVITNVCDAACRAGSDQCASSSVPNADATSPECTPDATPSGYKCKCAADFEWHSPTGQCIKVCDAACRLDVNCFCVEMCTGGCSDPKTECVEDLQDARTCACLPTFTQTIAGGPCVPFQQCYLGCGKNEVCGFDENGSSCICAEGHTRLGNGYGECVSSA